MLNQVKAKEVVTTIIRAIDIINPILKHHHRRTSIIAYHLGKSMGLSDKSLADLVIASSLHDVGALTVADKNALTQLDVHFPREHEILGASILSTYDPFYTISQIVRYHHIHFDDYMNGNYQGSDLPKESFILHLADRVEILLKTDDLALNQVSLITDTLKNLSGTLFSPEVLDHFLRLARKEYFWFDIEDFTIEELLSLIDMDLICDNSSLQSLEQLAFTLSRIVDYKSGFTISHSTGVAHVAYQLSKYYGFDDEKCHEIKLAGYLHDIGKIAIPSEILTKPSSLDTNEFNIMKSHPYYTDQILKKVKGFEQISKWASSHHETIDQTGYPRKPEKAAMSIEMQIISYADVFTALSEERPYRKALHLEATLQLLQTRFVQKFGEEIFSILKEHALELNDIRHQVQVRETQKYNEVIDSI